VPHLARSAPFRVAMEGKARHLGMDAKWKQEFCVSGAFWEELRNEHVHVWWGYDGKGKAWEVDFSGVPAALELDDMETSLLCTWVRNGMWLLPNIRGQLDIGFAPDCEPLDWQLLREQSESSETSGNSGTGSEGSAGMDGGHPLGAGDGGGSEIALEIRLLEGRVKARLAVCAQTWLPLELTLPVCGDIEKSTYGDWGSLGSQCDVVYPLLVKQVASGGGDNEYRAHVGQLLVPPTVQSSASSNSAASGGLDLFQLPTVPISPPDTRYDADVSPSVGFTQARSGHILVRPTINGREVDGLMILDTGASGFVITKSLADELELPSFGELYVAGVTRKVRSQFRRAATIQLGPVEMSNPLFMEMCIDGVVHGAPEPVVGIMGYDFFRRAVVEVPPLMQRQRAGPQGEEDEDETSMDSRILVHDPLEYDRTSGGPELAWQPLQLVANVPHIYATFGKEDGREHSALFMLDSGAGGAGIMFHARASAEYQLVEPVNGDGENATTKGGTTKSIRGIGGESSAGGMKVVEKNMSYLQISGARFENVLSLIATRGGFDLSLHTAGMICADLMVQCRVIFDYPRRRFAMVSSQE